MIKQIVVVVLALVAATAFVLAAAYFVSQLDGREELMNSETVIVRAAALDHNIRVLRTCPFGDALYSKLIDVRQVSDELESGKSVKEVLAGWE